jgi:hypothetical protein
VTNRTLIIKPGPRRLAAALTLAGFSTVVLLDPVTDACGKHWVPSELQIALALCGGESSGNATAYHVNTDGSIDYGLLEINGRAHAGYFAAQAAPAAWLWTDYLDNAEAAWEIYHAAGRSFRPWVAYTGGGFLAERYQGRSWMDWAAYGISQMLAAVAALTAQGKTQAAALAAVASVDDDPLVYWQ